MSEDFSYLVPMNLKQQILMVPAVSFGLLACAEDAKPMPVREGSYVEVRAILDRSCMNCHGGGQSPRLVTFEEVRAVAQSGQLMRSLDSLSPKSMPPGAPLPPEELAAIRSWIQNGMPADTQ